MSWEVITWTIASAAAVAVCGMLIYSWWREAQPIPEPPAEWWDAGMLWCEVTLRSGKKHSFKVHGRYTTEHKIFCDHILSRMMEEGRKTGMFRIAHADLCTDRTTRYVRMDEIVALTARRMPWVTLPKREEKK